MLYIRMLLSIVVSLYTSRVVLQTLGMENYGIYGVVGGIVSMFTFLNIAMARATSRFLSYEMGIAERGDCDEHTDTNRLNQTFSSVLLVHACLALIILILAITVGLWFLSNKLVIPNGRMVAAYWVYFCSILGMFVSVTQVPYNAAIIAHERMDIYACVELLNVFLKLGIVYLLIIGNFDKLILYAFLSLAVSVIVAFTYRIYCLRWFNETHFHFIWKPSILKPMLSFSGWSLYGVFCDMAQRQGTNFVVNIFWGVALNAATSIASTVQGTFNGLASQVTTAITPQVIKCYASDEISKMESLILFSVKLTGLLMGIFVVPILLHCDTIMSLWLVEVPEYAVVFCKIQTITGLFAMINSAVYNGIYAAGRMKDVNFITGTLYILTIPILYMLYKCGMSPTANQWLSFVVGIVVLMIDIIMLKKVIPQISTSRFLKSILLILMLIFISAIPTYFAASSFDKGLLSVITSFLVNGVVLFTLAFCILFTKEQRSRIAKMVKSRLHIQIVKNIYIFC